MQEYENIAYLDLQKTGSSTIKHVLSQTLDEEEIYKRAHRGIPQGFDFSKLCFISTRNPMSIYISLFNFGVGSARGSLRASLMKRGLGHYLVPSIEAFELWLNFVLDPQNARLLKADYGYVPKEVIGFLSFRLLYLSVPNSLDRLSKKKFQEPEQIRELFSKRVYADYVRQENLGGDLFAFLNRYSSRLRLRHPLTTAEDLIAQIPTKNFSAKIDGLIPAAISPELRQRVREREWLFYEAFGYDADPKGRPPESLMPKTDAGPIVISGSRAARREEKRARRRLEKREVS